jgi:tRNA pseudouridine55 synthase
VGVTGFLNLLKPPGLTSAQAVNIVRRRLGEKRIGHLGTLDPLAAGVLPLAVGQATRLIPYLPEHDKVYIAEAWFGLVTDTQDSSGRVLTEAPVPEADPAALLQTFLGDQMQVPPMASALHHEGKRLYDLFRAGQEVERPARPIRIERIELKRWQRPRLLFKVWCSPGTYVRTLCHDLGQKLGCGACMSFLLRTRSGAFEIEDAVALEEVGPSALTDANLALGHLLPLTLDGAQAVDVGHGRALEVPAPPGLVRLLDGEGRLLAVARSEGGRVHPQCVLNL